MKLNKKNKKNLKWAVLIAAGLVLVAIGIFLVQFGFNRLSRSDCTQYEQFDAIRGECYFECDTEEQCEAIAKKVDAELDAFFADSQSKIATDKPTSPALTSTNDTQPSSDADRVFTAAETGSDTAGKIYTVTKNQMLYPSPTAEDLDLWRLFMRIAPKEIIAERLETFEVFEDQNNDSAASVWESNTIGKWHMNVNAAFASDRKDLIHTLVHEFGHIVTLNSSQVEKTAGACPVITVPEGCVRAGTALGDFYAAFWQQYGDEAGGDSENPVAEFSEDEFVTEYASTNMIEDLAETFAYFVLRPNPSGSSIKDQKIAFLYARPEMVSLRNRIRAGLASEL